MNKQQKQSDYKNCYLIDKNFCEITKKRIAKVMGEVASIKNSSVETDKILDELAEIRNFFNWKDLRSYSNELRSSIDMERFIDPTKPRIQR